MKKVIPALFLLIMLAGSVSAAKVSYYPNKEAFKEFLSSNLTYQVVPGKDPWSKGWAIYIDEKLSRVKEHGNDTLVLVGNVYTNELMAEIWNRTGLDPSASLVPSIVVLNNTIFVTGSSKNLYITYESFSEIRIDIAKMLVIIGVILAYVIAMMIVLKRDKSYAGSMFLMGALLLGEWALLERIPSASISKALYLALARLNGAPVNDVSTVVLSYILKILPPDETLFWAVRWLLIFILLGATAYTAHRKERSLGVLAFFLTLSTPMFRRWLLTSNDAPGLLGLALVMAIVCSSNFAPSSSGVASVLTMSLFTVFGMIFNPYLAFLPLIFAVVFPGRTGRNASYLLLSSVGAIWIYSVFGKAWLLPWYPGTFNAEVLTYIAQGGLLQLTVLIYAGVRMVTSRNEAKIRKKGPTAFIGTLTIVLLLLTPFRAEVFPYLVYSLSVLAVRLLRSSPQI